MKMPPRQPGTSGSFSWPIRVYYEDTDAAGIVFYANYLKFFERARTEWLRACGIDQQRLADETGTRFAVRSTALDYLAPAQLDDLLDIRSRVDRLGRASADFFQEAWCGDRLLISGVIRVCCVRIDAGANAGRPVLKPSPLPPQVRAALMGAPAPAAEAVAS